MQDNNISDIIKSALENIKGIVDSDTLFGNPINTPSGTTIIPVSKISVGLASGGIDYNTKNKDDKNKLLPPNFGGGGGTGIVMTPVCFLVIKSDGNVEILNVNTSSSDPVSKEITEIVMGFIKRSPEYVSKIKTAFSCKKKNEKMHEDDVVSNDNDIVNQ